MFFVLLVRFYMFTPVMSMMSPCVVSSFVLSFGVFLPRAFLLELFSFCPTLFSPHSFYTIRWRFRVFSGTVLLPISFPLLFFLGQSPSHFLLAQFPNSHLFPIEHDFLFRPPSTVIFDTRLCSFLLHLCDAFFPPCLNTHKLSDSPICGFAHVYRAFP